MASIILRSRAVPKSASHLKWVIASISTSAPRCSDDVSKAVTQKEAPQIKNDLALLNREEVEQRKRLQGYITVDANTDLSSVSGVPEEHVKERKVRIYERTKSCMQSGTDNIGHWEIEFDVRERWDNPLMGWSSTGDPLSNMKIQFGSKDEAIQHCNKNGWGWFIQDSKLEKTVKPKSYAVNYTWNTRSRVSTK